jgi:hypothetical protein
MEMELETDSTKPHHPPPPTALPHQYQTWHLLLY